jgi:thymidylate synthase (FAD)
MPISAEREQEIEALRASTNATRRAVVPALEDILYQPLPVLDQGLIRVIDYMGDDGAKLRYRPARFCAST